MKIFAVVMGLVFCAAVGTPAQSPQQYAINARLSAGLPDASGTEVLAAPVLVAEEGGRALIALGNVPDGLTLSLSPTTLSAGKVAVRVVASNRRDGQTSQATFDLLSGLDTSSPMIALRDAQGAFMLSPQGRPLFLEIQVANRQQ